MTLTSSRTVLGAFALAVLSLGKPAQRQSCDLIVAALAAVSADSSNTVLVDQTVIGVPQFAFGAYSSIRRGDTALARVAEPQLRSLNQQRQPIPSCLVTDRHWRTIADSLLIPMFRSRDGWATFRERYGARAQFALISQPLTSGDTATLIVAIASGDLSGRGVLIQLVRDASGRWIKRSEAQLWIS